MNPLSSLHLCAPLKLKRALQEANHEASLLFFTITKREKSSETLKASYQNLQLSVWYLAE